MKENTDERQKSFDEINFDELPAHVANLVQALIPFAEMDRPGELKGQGIGGDEALHAALADRVLQRGRGQENTCLTNADFRNAARAVFDLTGAVPEAYWAYEIRFK